MEILRNALAQMKDRKVILKILHDMNEEKVTDLIEALIDEFFISQPGSMLEKKWPFRAKWVLSAQSTLLPPLVQLPVIHSSCGATMLAQETTRYPVCPLEGCYRCARCPLRAFFALFSLDAFLPPSS